MKTIDLNSDVGESFGRWTLGDDAAMFRSVSSANVACGFHAGDPSGLSATLSAAAGAGIVVGAHVGYRDLAGFGRRFMDISARELADDIVYQIGALRALAQVAGTQVRYVKPHGALGNAIVHHAGQAQAVVDAVAALDPSLAILSFPQSEVLDRAQKAGLRAVAECFADRAYSPDGTLVPRSVDGSVLHDPAEVAARAVRMAAEGKVEAADGSTLSVQPESICLHGDTRGAVNMAVRVREALDSAGVSVQSFV